MTNNIFCTLFDSNYLDKGITLYQSMQNNLQDFRLYVFAFDDNCYEVLLAENLPNLTVVSLKEFETPELLSVKDERTKAEYCWTCSPWIIKHVFDYYHETICTYIDADMFFFSDPGVVFEDMRKRGCSIIITPHRFPTSEEEEYARNRVGSYCVEFNTFVKNDDGLKALNWWAEKCLEWCYYAVPGTTEWYGDQKYLNVFPEKFDGVMICDHYGVGLAPWNIGLVEYCNEVGGVPQIKVNKTGECFPLILYHFEKVGFIFKHVLHSSSRTKSNSLYNAIYEPYISLLLHNREYIESKYSITLARERRVVTNHSIMKIYHKYISPIRRIEHLRDLYWVK